MKHHDRLHFNGTAFIASLCGLLGVGLMVAGLLCWVRAVVG